MRLGTFASGPMMPFLHELFARRTFKIQFHRCHFRVVSFGLLVFLVSVSSAPVVIGEVVGLEVTPTLLAEMQSTDAENRRLLAPARKSFEEGNLDQCRKDLDQAFAKGKSLAHPSVQLACWWIDSGNGSEAMTELERVAITQQDRPDVRYVFAEIALSQRRYFDAWTHAQAGVDVLASKSTTPRPWSDGYAKHMGVQLLRTKARIADARGDWETSAKLLTTLRDGGDESAEVAIALGKAAFYLDDPDTAINHFRNAAKADENVMLAELMMAALYEQNNNVEQTEAWLSGKKSKANPSVDGTQAETIRAEYVRWLLRQNRPADARTQATLSRPSEANRRDFEYLVALADRMSGRFDASEKILSALHQDDATNFAVANQLALVLIESDDEGKRGRALQLATRLVKSNPKSSDAISTYGWVLYRLGDASESMEVFSALMQGGQLSRDAAFYLAQVKRSLAGDDEGVAKEVTLLIDAAKTSKGEFFNGFRVSQKL